MRWSIFVVLLAAACNGSGSVGDVCHASADCATDLYCDGPNDPQGCGIGPREQCGDDTQCSGGDRCWAIPDGCSADGVGSECRAPCSSDGQCGSGFHCDAGACAAIRCDAGQSCASREVCDLSRITAVTPIFDRTSGCFPRTCSGDGDCGANRCVNGVCQETLGTCRENVIVP